MSTASRASQGSNLKPGQRKPDHVASEKVAKGIDFGGDPVSQAEPLLELSKLPEAKVPLRALEGWVRRDDLLAVGVRSMRFGKI